MNEPRLKILPPWSVYIKKLEALFDGDPQIAFNVDWSGEHPSVTLVTNNPDKAAALLVLLPNEKKFGDVSLIIAVDCETISNLAFEHPKDLFETAFHGNPAFAYAVTPEDYWYVPFTYVVFKNCCVQINADNLRDPHGLISTLYQDIAAEIFADMNYPGDWISYCTDIEKNIVGMPKNWP